MDINYSLLTTDAPFAFSSQPPTSIVEQHSLVIIIIIKTGRFYAALFIESLTDHAFTYAFRFRD